MKNRKPVRILIEEGKIADNFIGEVAEPKFLTKII